MRIVIDLSPRDLAYFRDCLRRVRERVERADERPVIDGAERLVGQALASEPPDFVRTRVEQLYQLAAMLRDEDWRLEGEDRARVLNALAYFVDPDDLIPDRVPGIGYLDDAIMVELVVQELRHEIQAYRDFCAYRDSLPEEAKGQALVARRDSLQTRMRRRRRRERRIRAERGARGSRGSRRVFGLW